MFWSAQKGDCSVLCELEDKADIPPLLCRFMADQVIGYLQDIGAYVLKTHGNGQSAPHPEVVHEVLRQPIFSGNHAEKPETCLLDDQFKALAVGGHVRLSPILLTRCMVLQPHPPSAFNAYQTESLRSVAPLENPCLIVLSSSPYSKNPPEGYSPLESQEVASALIWRRSFNIFADPIFVA